MFEFKKSFVLEQNSSAGFTLIEVLFALFIASVLLTGVVVIVGGIADQRINMQQRFAAESIAWNKLVEQYQLIEGLASNNLGAAESSGVDEALGRQWLWQIAAEPTFGDDFYRYQVDVYLQGLVDAQGTVTPVDNDSQRSSADLAAYFIVE